MRALNLFEEAHIVNALPPIDITGGQSSDVWSMKNFRGANILLQAGVSAAAWTKILLFACDDFAGTNPVAIPFKIYKCETALDDKFTSNSDVTAAGYTPSANDNIMYGIYVDSQALASLGKECLYVQVTNGANSVIGSMAVILTGAGSAAEPHDCARQAQNMFPLQGYRRQRCGLWRVVGRLASCVRSLLVGNPYPGCAHVRRHQDVLARRRAGAVGRRLSPRDRYRRI
jgi:hypothetical protein